MDIVKAEHVGRVANIIHHENEFSIYARDFTR